MTGMVGGLHNRLLSFFGWGGGGCVKRRVRMGEDGWDRGAGMQRRIVVFCCHVSRLVRLQWSRESTLHLSVNCFSSASDPDLDSVSERENIKSAFQRISSWNRITLQCVTQGRAWLLSVWGVQMALQHMWHCLKIIIFLFCPFSNSWFSKYNKHVNHDFGILKICSSNFYFEKSWQKAQAAQDVTFYIFWKQRIISQPQHVQTRTSCRRTKCTFQMCSGVWGHMTHRQYLSLLKSDRNRIKQIQNQRGIKTVCVSEG